MELMLWWDQLVDDCKEAVLPDPAILPSGLKTNLRVCIPGYVSMGGRDILQSVIETVNWVTGYQAGLEKQNEST